MKAVGPVPDPDTSSPFYGQDAQYITHRFSYTDNGDDTITDNVTGLMWTRDPGAKMSWRDAVENAPECRTGNYTDWRLPGIKELYSLIDMRGSVDDLIPFIDPDYFLFSWGNEADGERIIDSQYASATEYVSTIMGGSAGVFGVNFADGRIKGYGRDSKLFYVMYVRGNPDYGVNSFVDNQDGTVTDNATGLMWMQIDSGHLNAGSRSDGTMDWQEALAWAEALEYAGYSDWRMPNTKELQSIVDYTRSPDTSSSAAIDPIFKASQIINEGGAADYPYYWTGTTHVGNNGKAVYQTFGEAPGYKLQVNETEYSLLDVHGAGAQRSDPKTGDPADWPYGQGPQGDVIRIFNHVRCVRAL